MSYKKRKSQDYFEEPRYRSFTRIDYLLGVISIFGLFIIGVRHFDTFGKTNLMECAFALVGLLLIDFVRTGESGFKKQFKPFDFYTVPRFLVLLITNVVIQALAKYPFTVENIELGLSIIFASVAEELFFRGFLISIFKKVSFRYRDPEKEKLKQISLFGTFDLNLRPTIILGCFVSALFFALIHRNYYADLRMMYALFFGGLVWAFLYVIWDDLSANILAHFILNIYTAWMQGLLILTFV